MEDRNDPPTPKGVLLYLREMIEYCKLEHRPEIQEEYEEAWRMAAQKLYGPLPDRWQTFVRRQTVTVNNCPETPKPKTFWRNEMHRKPLRKVIRIFTKTRPALLPYPGPKITDRYLELECGHVMLDNTPDPLSPTPQRRRCGECPRIGEKKTATSTTSTKKGKSASA